MQPYSGTIIAIKLMPGFAIKGKQSVTTQDYAMQHMATCDTINT